MHPLKPKHMSPFKSCTVPGSWPQALVAFMFYEALGPKVKLVGGACGQRAPGSQGVRPIRAGQLPGAVF